VSVDGAPLRPSSPVSISGSVRSTGASSLSSVSVDGSRGSTDALSLCSVSVDGAPLRPSSPVSISGSVRSTGASSLSSVSVDGAPLLPSSPVSISGSVCSTKSSVAEVTVEEHLSGAHYAPLEGDAYDSLSDCASEEDETLLLDAMGTRVQCGDILEDVHKGVRRNYIVLQVYVTQVGNNHALCVSTPKGAVCLQDITTEQHLMKHGFSDLPMPLIPQQYLWMDKNRRLTTAHKAV
jgi:hypothetical protein